MTTSRPITILIAALGGQGGGVLTDWIVRAAQAQGFAVQSTSIPGVAQRTGATTYYVEIVPQTVAQLGGRQPVLALSPGVGDIDVAVASELMEAGRNITGGFVTPDRTLMIASTARAYIVSEKMAMADGRYDSERIVKAIRAHAQAALLLDMDQVATQSGAMINAVMLGLIAGCGRVPLSVTAFEAAIRGEGKAADANLRGFRAGLEAARAQADAGVVSQAAPQATPQAMAGPAAHRRPQAGADSLAGLERDIAETIAPAARDIVVEGVRRLAAYQDLAYARLYLDRLRPVAAADHRANAAGALLRETARHLAVRMSFEDVIRVAQAKISPARFARIAEELKALPGEPYAVVEFLKPGIEELCSLLPPRVAKPMLAYSQRRGWLGRVYFGMEVRTTSINGFLRFWLLAKLRRWRPRSHRFHEEQAAIESWLGLIVEAAWHSGDLALEVADCARLIKGYGDTHARGTANYALIAARVIGPVLAGRYAVARGIDAIASARTAALADPEGQSLARCLAAIEAQAPFRIAAE